MSAPEVRTPGGSQADTNDAGQKVRSLQTAERPRKTKTGRSRYLRFFPERVYFLLAHLNEREFVAYVRLLTAYVVADGELPADDKQLALITKMGKHWPELRDKLLKLGLGRIENGFWIDDDQKTNLNIQCGLSDRGAKGAMARWGGSHA